MISTLSGLWLRIQRVSILDIQAQLKRALSTIPNIRCNEADRQALERRLELLRQQSERLTVATVTLSIFTMGWSMVAAYSFYKHAEEEKEGHPNGGKSRGTRSSSTSEDPFRLPPVPVARSYTMRLFLFELSGMCSSNSPPFEEVVSFLVQSFWLLPKGFGL